MVDESWRVVWQMAQTAGHSRGTASAGNKRRQLAETCSRSHLASTARDGGTAPQQQVFPATCTLGRQAVTHGGNNTQAGALEAHVFNVRTDNTHKQVIHRAGADTAASQVPQLVCVPALPSLQHNTQRRCSSQAQFCATERWLSKLPSCQKCAGSNTHATRKRRLQRTCNMQASAVAVHTNNALNATQQNATFSRRHTTHGTCHAHQQEL